MSRFIDFILLVPNFEELVSYLKINNPDLLKRNEDGSICTPPVVIGFARTPSVIGEDNNSLMTYSRLRPDEIRKWRDIPGVEILSECPYEGVGTADKVYNKIFNDPEKDLKYKQVYNYEPYEVIDEDTGESYTITPPKMFGVLLGS